MSYIHKLVQSAKVIAAGGLVALTVNTHVLAQDRPLTHGELTTVVDIFARGKYVKLDFGSHFFEFLDKRVRYSRLDIGRNGVYDITIFYDFEAVQGDYPIGVFFENGDAQWSTRRGDLYYFREQDGLYHRGTWNEDIRDI